VASSVKMAMGQIRVDAGRVEANLCRAVEMIGRAAGERCEIVVLPECLDVGWAADEARELAQPIPGPSSDVLVGAAREHQIHVVAGITERVGERTYNTAVLIDPSGKILLCHRKLNELDIAHPFYSIGDSLRVAETSLGTIAVNICADNFTDSLVFAHAQARMGAQLLLSPCAWAVDADHDNAKDPYGPFWLRGYRHLASLYGMGIVAVSNVGPMTSGPWKGRKCIGCSLAVGPDGQVLAQGPYGESAEALVVVDVPIRPALAEGATFAARLRERGYDPACILGGPALST
jgi:predicted amidohydrolase